jgi:hypothetical protein
VQTQLAAILSALRWAPAYRSTVQVDAMTVLQGCTRSGRPVSDVAVIVPVMTIVGGSVE